MVRTPHFHCPGTQVRSLVGDLRFCMPREVQPFLFLKKKQTNKSKTDYEMIVLTEGITNEMMA